MYNVIDPEVQIVVEFHGNDEAAEKAFNKLASVARDVGIEAPARRGGPFVGLNDIASWSWTFVGHARDVVRFLQLVFANSE